MDALGRDRPRLAELVASLSFATDAIMGQPMEHALRSCVVGMRLGELAGMDLRERTEIYWVSMLAWIGCSADPHELARHFGDDIEVYSSAYREDLTGMTLMRFLAGRATRGRTGTDRLRELAWLVASGSRWANEVFSGKCEIAEDLAARLGMPHDIRDRLQQVYERWDGKGSPRRVKKEALAPSVRAFHIAEIAEVHHQIGGVDGATEVVRSRRGTQFEPTLADLFCANAAQLFDGMETGVWDAVLAAEPAPHVRIRDDQLEQALEAIGDLAGLKSPFLADHPRGVASLGEAAARLLELGEAEATSVRRAGLIHDLGRMSVTNAIWDKPGPLTDAEREQVRLHAYYTERMLARSFLAPLGALASLHHERCDGSGYHRGVDAAALTTPARVLAAADAYHAMVEARPHRPALSPDRAADELRAAVRDGAFDVRVADAVLEAAGHRVGRRREWPAGLSEREIEVLRLLALGHSKKQIASALFIAPATADHHVRHIYTKAGVTTRAGATLFAMRHRLLDPLAAE